MKRKISTCSRSSSSSSDSSSSSSSSCSSNSHSSDDEKEKYSRKKLKKIKKKVKKKEKKHAKKLKKKIKKLKREKKEHKMKEKQSRLDNNSSLEGTSDFNVGGTSTLIKGGIKPEDLEKSKARAPMTKEEWEKQQSIVRRVYDTESGRTRLVKGDGEILEECVSRERHLAINKAATQGDGQFFQSTLMSKVKK